MTTLSQRSFSAGEVSPSLYARVDLTKYATGLRTCRNNLILRYGGSSNRPGTMFVGEVNGSLTTARLIPFIFNVDQTYILEFGDQYLRVIKDGAYLTDLTETITGITSANPAVVTSTGHGFSNGEEVAISGVLGMTEVNNRNFLVANAGVNTFELQYLDGTNVDSTGFGTYSSGGEASRVYEIVTPYLEAALEDIHYVQSADVVTIVHPDYAPRELTRTADTSWSLDVIDFLPDAIAPYDVAASVGGAGSNTYRYKVTSISSEDGEESLPGVQATYRSPSAISKANPAVVTDASHPYATNDEVYFENVGGMTELNGRIFRIEKTGTNTYTLLGIDSTDYTTYTSGARTRLVFAEITSADEPDAAGPHNITWDIEPTASEYNVYKESNGVYGLIGIASNNSFDDIGQDIDTTSTPPASRNPFVGTDNYPSVVTYIQQRLAFANTNNDTEKIFLSRTANFHNFTTSSPLQDDDAITFTMAGRQVNAVKSMLDLGRLVILTSGGEWAAAGNEAGVIRPTDINTKQYSYNGSADLDPVIIDGAAIYQQARGSIIRDLGYDFQVDGYKGNDLTIFSSHLFDEYTLVDWAYQQIPHSILWVVRSDGTLLGMTFVRNQEIIAWHRHDLAGGFVENVAVVPEGNEDSLYLIVRRTIDGNTKRYVEKLTTRQITDVVDSTFMDCHLTYDGRNTGSTTMTLSGGSTWAYDEDLTLTASASYFTASDVGNAIHLTGASGDVIRAAITAYTSPTVVTVRAHKTVPTELRAVAVTNWTEAVDRVAGLWHIEGEDVAVFADGFVVASPNNESYTTVTVTNGVITLDKPYGVIHVGLPYLSDVETLDIDTPRGETIMDKEKIVSEVNLYVEDTRGIWVGGSPPSDDSVDPLEGLTELKIRSEEDYDSPVSLTTDSVEIQIRAEWNSHGRVFIRQVDPIPMTILSVNPAGKFPFRG